MEFKKTMKDVIENRKSFIEYLRNPNLKKRIDKLGDKNGNYCVLGHACLHFGLEPELKDNKIMFENESILLPKSIVEKLKLRDDIGSVEDPEEFTKNVKKVFNTRSPHNFVSLSALNDWTSISLSKIADVLELLIEGGDMSPFEKV